MSIPLMGRFDYLAVVPADSKRPHPWHATTNPQEDRDPFPLFRDDRQRLVGWNPTLQVSEGVVTLTATNDKDASIREASFRLDPALLAAARHGTVLRLLRTGSGWIAVSAGIDGELVFAVGAVCSLQLDAPDIRRGFGPRPRPPEWGARPGRRDTWIEVRSDNVIAVLRDGEETVAGDHVIRVVRNWRDTEPSTDESVAVFPRDGTLRDPAVRSAELLANTKGGCHMVRWESRDAT